MKNTAIQNKDQANTSTQELTEASTTKRKKKTVLPTHKKGLFLGMVAFFVVTMSLLHIFFPPFSNEYVAHRKTYKPIIRKRDSTNLALLEQFTDKITTQAKDSVVTELSKQLILEYKNHLDKANLRLQQYTKIKNELVQAQSFRGRSSFRFWIFMFGLTTLSLFFSCKSLFDDLSKGSSYRFQLLSLSGIFVSLFWITHLLFQTEKDFEQNTYVFAILLVALLASIFTYFLIKNYTYKDDIILRQLSLIDRIKTIHYPKVAIKALYSERNDKAMLSTDTVRENADAFDDDIVNTLKEI
ncbi:hypothetical protein [Tenacibaculum litopenaei]|uniref:hypothetical protein n=1 Tax=Tenacibaculum litopenaei TaxID=396016 RepID=UPI0038B6743A